MTTQQFCYSVMVTRQSHFSLLFIVLSNARLQKWTFSCLNKWFITAQIAFCHCTFSIHHCTFCASLRIILCPVRSVCCRLGVSHFAESNSPVPLLPESTPVSLLSTEYHSWSCVVAASASFYGRRDRAVPVHRLAFHRCRCVARMPYSQVFEPLLAGQSHLIVWDRSRLLEVHAASHLSG